MRWLYCLSLLLVSLSACGSSESADDETANASAAHDGFIGQVNRICSEASASRAALDMEIDRLASVGDYDALTDRIDQMTMLNSDWTVKLKALRPPPADSDAFARYLTALETQNRGLVTFLFALRAQDPAGIASVQAAQQQVVRHRIDAANDLGADQCAQPLSGPELGSPGATY